MRRKDTLVLLFHRHGENSIELIYNTILCVMCSRGLLAGGLSFHTVTELINMIKNHKEGAKIDSNMDVS